jgi:hypothetical protein
MHHEGPRVRNGALSGSSLGWGVHNSVQVDFGLSLGACSHEVLLIQPIHICHRASFDPSVGKS